MTKAHRLPGCQEEFKPRMYETPFSCWCGRPATCDPHALGGAQRGEHQQRRADLKHIRTKHNKNNKNNLGADMDTARGAEWLPSDMQDEEK